MAAPVKDGKVWRHRVMVSGKRHSGTFPTKAHALAWEAEKRALAGGGAATSHTCADAFERYEREVSVKKPGHRWEKFRLAAFAATPLGRVKMSELSETHFAAWRDARLREVAPGSVTREMNLLSHVFNVARKEWKWLQTTPMKDVSRPKSPPHRSRRISDEEIAMLCRGLDWAPEANEPPRTKRQAIALALLFALETAMRAGEICALRSGDVTGRVARLHTSKNGLGRDVPLSPEARRIWALVPEGFGLTSGSLDAMFRRVRDNAQIIGLTFHDSRHEAITRLARKMPVLDLARMTGHTDIRELMTYYNASAEDIADLL